MHPRRDRRKKAEQQEGLELSALVRASKADALCDEARDVLIRRIEGVSLRPAHRPIRISSNSDLNTIRYMSAYLKLHIQDRLEASQPLDIPDWGVVEEDARSIKMPLATRALYLAGKELSDRGFDVPALPRLRNLIIGLEANIRELKVNDRERDPV